MPANGTLQADQRAGCVKENDLGFALDLQGPAIHILAFPTMRRSGSYPAFFIWGNAIYEFRTHSDA
jgi:hypothetical protein